MYGLTLRQSAARIVNIMAEALTHEHVENFRRARWARDPRLIEPFLDDHVDWLLTGPIELLQFCGQRRGKAEVLDCLTRQHHTVLSTFHVERNALLIDRDRAASLSRLTGVQRSTGRTISYNQAQFLRFRNGKIFEYRGIIDSFNAAEQMIGRPFEVGSVPHNYEGDRIAI
jgi:ketosteroid isomerase-like protein